MSDLNNIINPESVWFRHVTFYWNIELIYWFDLLFDNMSLANFS